MQLMNTSRFLISVLATLLAVTGCNAAESATAVAKVNGVTIPQSRLELFVKNAVAQGQPDTPELRARFRDELIAREIMVQEATKKGLDKNSDVAMQLEVQRQGVLINAYLREYMRANPITEDMLKKEYEKAKAQPVGNEYKARHILVKQEDEAKQLIAQLKKGGNFEKLAAEKSEDQGSKARGGDLDWAPPNRYVKPFSEALTKLKKGQLTETPVQTQYGWHVIRLDDERPTRVPSFEEVKNNIQQHLQQQTAQKAIAELRAKAKIE